MIILLHRDIARHGSETGPEAGIVAENRNGPAGRIMNLASPGPLGRLAGLGNGWGGPV